MNIVEKMCEIAWNKIHKPEYAWGKTPTDVRAKHMADIGLHIAALADNVTDEMMIAFCENYPPTEQFAPIDAVKAKLRNAISAALRTGSGAGE